MPINANGQRTTDDLAEISGNVVASYSYDTWGNLTSASENIPNHSQRQRLVNPFRFDERDGVRYDVSPPMDSTG